MKTVSMTMSMTMSMSMSVSVSMTMMMPVSMSVMMSMSMAVVMTMAVCVHDDRWWSSGVIHTGRWIIARRRWMGVRIGCWRGRVIGGRWRGRMIHRWMGWLRWMLWVLRIGIVRGRWVGW